MQQLKTKKASHVPAFQSKNTFCPAYTHLLRYIIVPLQAWEKSFTENVIYEKLLADKLPANLGYVYENLVAQMLVAAGKELYYHNYLPISARIAIFAC